MKSILFLSLAAFVVLFPTEAHASIEFNLRDEVVIEPLDGGTTLTLTNGGITATLTALVDGVEEAGSVFNVTRDGFGINALDGDDTSPNDDTKELDGDQGIESISIVFRC